MWEDELLEILKPAERIFLKIKCDCYCCVNVEPIFIEVNASSDEGVTVKDAIEALVASNYEPECSMITLTGFEKLSEDFYRPIFFV
jgi:hypothetical protein